MLDVQFLLEPQFALTKPIVYLYRQGFLRHEVLDAITNSAAKGGELVLSSNYLGLFAGGGLFSGVPFCDASIEGAIRGRLDVRNAAIAFASGAVAPAVLFVRHDDDTLCDELVAAAGESCLVLCEPAVNEASLGAILNYLHFRSDLVPSTDLLSQDGFRSYFWRYFQANPVASFADLAHEFDRVVLLFVDPVSGRFSHEFVSAELEGDRALVAGPLRRMVVDRDAWSAAKLLEGLERRHSASDSPAVVADLVRHTRNLIKSGSGEQSSWSAAVVARVSLWSALLLVHLDDLAASGSALVGINELICVYLGRSAFQTGHNPLKGYWPQLHVAVSRDDAKALQNDLIGFDAKGDNFRWMSRLRSVLAAPPVPSDVPSLAVARRLADSVPDPVAFRDVVGHKDVVAALRRKSMNGGHSKPLMLLGPDGVGKTTIARLYGRALVCEAVQDGMEDACGICAACQLFDQGLDVHEFDARAGASNGYVQETLLDRLRFEPLTRRRIVIIHNAEFNHRLIDMCLKTLEQKLSSTAFVLLVTDMAHMNAAGMSRCEVHRLGTLRQDEMGCLCARFADQLLFACEPRVLDLLRDASAGLPGLLLSRCKTLASEQAPTLDQALIALDMGWGPGAVGYWRLLLAADHPTDVTPAYPEAVGSRTAWQRTRAALNAVFKASRSGDIQDIVFSAHRQDLISLGATMADLAQRLNIERDELWRRLASLWDDEDYADDEGFVEASLLTKSVMRGSYTARD